MAGGSPSPLCLIRWLAAAAIRPPPKGKDDGRRRIPRAARPCRRRRDRVTSVLVTHTEPVPCRTQLVLSDSLKLMRETLCIAQSAIAESPVNWSKSHGRRLQNLIKEIDRHRPLGPDGKHGDRHTETCGCERPGLHCVHWHDGDNCCRCGAPRDPDVCPTCGDCDCPGGAGCVSP